jgi:peptide chain release factor 2
MQKEGDSVEAELEQALDQLFELVDEAELSRMLSGKYDPCVAILTIHPGAGGTESQDWGSMLTRMYMRYAERNGFQLTVLDYQDGDEAGIKSVTLRMAGPMAYGYLKAEGGVHRLVRISPFDASKRRHTSFCSVHVTPELEDDSEVVIDDKDLRIDTFRASGAGGQHINKTDSAIRITHFPSGIVVSCQNERSQHQNREAAMKILRSKLAQIQEEERLQEISAAGGEKREIGWGSQIRSYVLHPYQMVKDHRTQVETSATDKVLDGDLKAFIRAYLLSGQHPS